MSNTYYLETEPSREWPKHHFVLTPVDGSTWNVALWRNDKPSAEKLCHAHHIQTTMDVILEEARNE